MENATWYTWDDMTPWRLAILGGVVLVTLVVIKLVERYGAVESDDDVLDFASRDVFATDLGRDAHEWYFDPINSISCANAHHRDD